MTNKSHTLDRSAFETLSKMSHDKSNTSQMYTRFQMGRNLNQSYLTRGSHTPTGKKEFKLDDKSEYQKEEMRNSRKSGSECDELSQMELSMDYI